MNQTRLQSLIEAVLNTAIGFVISLVVGLLVFPLFGWHPSFSTNFWVTCVFTVTSVLRSYFVRRFFNARLHSAAERLSNALKD